MKATGSATATRDDGGRRRPPVGRAGNAGARVPPATALRGEDGGHAAAFRPQLRARCATRSPPVRHSPQSPHVFVTSCGRGVRPVPHPCAIPRSSLTVFYRLTPSSHCRLHCALPTPALPSTHAAPAKSSQPRTTTQCDLGTDRERCPPCGGPYARFGCGVKAGRREDDEEGSQALEGRESRVDVRARANHTRRSGSGGERTLADSDGVLVAALLFDGVLVACERT